jgi:hypothetical protein
VHLGAIMAGRISKLVGGIGASLAIVVAGATGATWLASKNANVADGAVVQQGTGTSAETPQQAVASPAAPQSLNNLSVDVTPPVKNVIISEHWVVSSTATVEEFPLEKNRLPSLSCISKDFATSTALYDCLGATPGCTPAQRDWLSKNALLVNDGLSVYEGRIALGGATLTNTSTSAQSISFKDIRLEAEFAPFADAGFSIVCSNYNDWSGGAAAGYSMSRDVILPAGNGTAVFGGPSMYGEDLTRDIPAGMPAVFNLAAGETSIAALSVQVPYPVGTMSGRVLATVSAADGEKEIEVPRPLLSSGKSGYGPRVGATLWIDGGTVCPDKKSATKYTTMRTVCSFAQLKAQAKNG